MTLTERASALYAFMVALNRFDERDAALAGFDARKDLNAALSHAEALLAALERSKAGAQPLTGSRVLGDICRCCLEPVTQAWLICERCAGLRGATVAWLFAAARGFDTSPRLPPGPASEPKETA